LGNYEFCKATIQTDQQLWKDEDKRRLQSLESGEMNAYFSLKLALVLRVTILARHSARASET
jgi:hypothetical protein